MAQVSATPQTGNNQMLKKSASEERPKELNGLQKVEHAIGEASSSSKRKFLIRRDTPMDLSKQHLKQNNYRPAFTEAFVETTNEGE